MSGLFTMPSLGADMEAGTLVEWLVKPGDAVKRGDIVAVVETQKGAIDVEIFEDGVIAEIRVPVGEEVPVGTVLATLEGADVPEAPSPEPAAEAPSKVEPPKLSPRAKRRAVELGVDPSAIVGTGPGGSITGEDIEKAASTKPPGTNMREAIASAMTRAHRDIPQYALQHGIDLEPALQWLEAQNADRPILERMLPVTLLVRAVARALAKHSELAGRYVDGRFEAAAGMHIGLAVTLRGGGLINPTIRDADQGSLPELWSKIRDLTERARNGGLRSSEMTDGAITITSLGDRGVDVVHGIIFPPQVALVGFGTVSKRPWVVDDQIQVRRVVEASLAADHRVTDGHLGARFLHRVGRLLQEPQSL